MLEALLVFCIFLHSSAFLSERPCFALGALSTLLFARYFMCSVSAALVLEALLVLFSSLQSSPLFLGRLCFTTAVLVLNTICLLPFAVEAEAARIRKGERFNNFQEFDRCLDSWAVMNGRVVYRLKTFPHFVTRVCRFNKLVPKTCKHGNDNAGNSGPGAVQVDLNNNDRADSSDDDSSGNMTSADERADSSEDELDQHYNSRYGEYTGWRQRGSASKHPTAIGKENANYLHNPTGNSTQDLHVEDIPTQHDVSYAVIVHTIF